MCLDYDPKSAAWVEFYRNTQAKLIFAIASHTPAELIAARVDSGSENIGLQTWAKATPRKSDVTISKNYLHQAEIKELNRLTTIVLDIFEDQLYVGRLKTMAEAKDLLDAQLAGLGRSVLRTGGRVSNVDADAHAQREYDRFQAKRKALRDAEADNVISEIKATQKALPREAKPPRST